MRLSRKDGFWHSLTMEPHSYRLLVRERGDRTLLGRIKITFSEISLNWFDTTKMGLDFQSEIEYSKYSWE